MFIKIQKLTRHLFGSRDTEPKTKSKRKVRVNPSNPYHAVSVRFIKNNACEAAKKLGDTRLLASQATTLPLPGCTNSSRCKCTFVHHQDRRSGPRRDADVGMPGATFTGEDRRQHRHGRRKTDNPLHEEGAYAAAPDYYSFSKTSASRDSRQKAQGDEPPADDPQQQ